VSEIVSTLLPEEQQAQQGNRSGASAAPTAALLAAADESPYISKPGCALPFKVPRMEAPSQALSLLLLLLLGLAERFCLLALVWHACASACHCWSRVLDCLWELSLEAVGQPVSNCLCCRFCPLL
jgi:hypothetical protein